MMSAFVGTDAFRLICVRCVVLEECSVSLSIQSLVRVRVTDAVETLILKSVFRQRMFEDLIPHMRLLHTAHFNIRDIKRGRLMLEILRASEMIEKPNTPALRRLSINDVYWQASESSCVVVIELTFYVLSPRMTGFVGVRGTVRCEMGRVRKFQDHKRYSMVKLLRVLYGNFLRCHS